MPEEPCPVCGERNPAHTTFCNFCGAYLGWDDEDEPTGVVLLDDPVRERLRTERVADQPSTGDWRAPSEHNPPPPEATMRIQVPPHARSGRDEQDRTRHSSEIDPDSGVQVEITQREVVVSPGSGPTTVTLQVSNISSVVEAYDVAVVRPPPWLQVVPGRVELLPGTHEEVSVTLSIRAEDLVPVQRARLRLRVQGASALSLRRDVSVDLVVAAVAASLGLQLEPTTLRARDTTTALFRVVVDNRRSNQGQRVQFAGSDPELAARFTFTPPTLEVPPGAAVAARVRVDAPLPEPGEQLSRELLITAFDGAQEHHVRGSFVQATSAVVEDPPVALRLDPSTVKVQNASSGHTSVIVDNRRGHRPQHVTLAADDDEGVVQFTVSPERLEVPPGELAMARVTMRAPRPDGGQQVGRQITVTAWNGQEVCEARGQFVQSSSDRRPMTRAALTALGSAAILLGTFQAWTSSPRRSGHEWSITNVNNALEIPDDPMENALDQAGVHGLVDAVVSGGAIALLLGALALFGLTGRTGRLTRVAALLCLLFVVVLLVALNTLASAGFAAGAVVVLLGCVAAFVGGLLAKRQ